MYGEREQTEYAKDESYRVMLEARDMELTELLGDYEVSELESANPERYVSEADYMADRSDIVSDEMRLIADKYSLPLDAVNGEAQREVIAAGLGFYSIRLRWF
jgi:hypothetical protein